MAVGTTCNSPGGFLQTLCFSRKDPALEPTEEELAECYPEDGLLPVASDPCSLQGLALI